MNALVDFCPEAISAAVGSVVRCGDDTELYMPTATFVTQLMHSTRAVSADAWCASDERNGLMIVIMTVITMDPVHWLSVTSRCCLCV